MMAKQINFKFFMKIKRAFFRYGGTELYKEVLVRVCMLVCEWSYSDKSNSEHQSWMLLRASFIHLKENLAHEIRLRSYLENVDIAKSVMLGCNANSRTKWK